MSSKDITKKEVIEIIGSESRLISDFCLSLVLLTTKELKVLELCYRKGLTEVEASEKMYISRTTVQRIKKKAISKCLKAWNKTETVRKIINEEV